MILHFVVASDCEVLVAEAEVEQLAGGGWLEVSRLEVSASPSCRWVQVPLPPGVDLVDARAHERLGDGTRRKLGPERWETTERSIGDEAVATLHTPDLLSGDRVVLTVTRRIDAGPIRWSPGPARFASLVHRGVDREKHRTWAGDVGAEWGVPLDDGAVRATVAPAAPAGDVRVERRLTLLLPPGDPQVVLYPGGGSRVRVEDFLTAPPAEEIRAWPVDVPRGATVEVTPSPANAAILDGATLLIQPSTTPSRIRVAWEEPDAPTYGERDPRWDRLDVEVEGGVVRREGDGWFLHRAAGEVVIPDRSALQRALDARFRALAIPEPGAPMELRSADPSWTTAGMLRDVLLTRATVADWPTAQPLLPRKLHAAVRSGVVSPVEASLVTWLWARQVRLDADWLLVRPATDGPSGPTVLAGYDAALVRITADGEVRWLDPGCTMCAPFEVRPDLEGASVLGARDLEGPAPTAGLARLEVGARTLRWRLEGPAALELRLWLQEVESGDRAALLAQRLGGPGATLLELDGLPVAGAPIDVLLERGGGLFRDPLATGPGAETVWWPWVGERIVRWEGRRAEPFSLNRAELGYQRSQDGDVVEERLIVRARMVPVEVARALDQARLSPPEPVPSPP
jgi:hypothetical protein